MPEPGTRDRESEITAFDADIPERVTEIPGFETGPREQETSTQRPETEPQEPRPGIAGTGPEDRQAETGAFDAHTRLPDGDTPATERDLFGAPRTPSVEEAGETSHGPEKAADHLAPLPSPSQTEDRFSSPASSADAEDRLAPPSPLSEVEDRFTPPPSSADAGDRPQPPPDGRDGLPPSELSIGGFSSPPPPEGAVTSPDVGRPWEGYVPSEARWDAPDATRADRKPGAEAQPFPGDPLHREEREASFGSPRPDQPSFEGVPFG